MGKKIKITENQLSLITKSVINESNTVDKYKAKYEAFKKDMRELKLYSNYTKDMFEFLDLIRESGIVNMYQASTFLWGGSDFIKRHVEYHYPHIADPYSELEDEEAEVFDENNKAYLEILDKADEIRRHVISAAATTISDNIENDRDIQRHVERLANTMLAIWMRHFGTKYGRKSGELEEMSRSLAFSRRQRLFPKNAKKYNKLRFRPAMREVTESDVVLTEMDVTCQNCGHEWDIRPEDTEPHLCHMCGYDQIEETFFVDKVVEFWQEYLNK
jgi:predicted Zn-ribbon and HTH transcriptional regulator